MIAFMVERKRDVKRKLSVVTCDKFISFELVNPN
ncbi:hypothetical protein SAMN05443582_10380 [Phyllobacterium sp. OV277]|nr:hypothetical protein SAMN05443582_10380 [Phyllobacterium sp. OV277]